MRMPRLTLDPEACTYHCVARTINQIWFFETAERRDLAQNIILSSSSLYGANLPNFVVMSNHIQLLV